MDEIQLLIDAMRSDPGNGDLRKRSFELVASLRTRLAACEAEREEAHVNCAGARAAAAELQQDLDLATGNLTARTKELETFRGAKCPTCGGDKALPDISHDAELGWFASVGDHHCRLYLNKDGTWRRTCNDGWFKTREELDRALSPSVVTSPASDVAKAEPVVKSSGLTDEMVSRIYHHKIRLGYGMDAGLGFIKMHYPDSYEAAVRHWNSYERSALALADKEISQ